MTGAEEQTLALRTALAAELGAACLDVIETHISVLALSADRVFKARKAVRFAFLDCSTPQARRADCEREVALNRRLAPDVYLGVETLPADSAAAGEPYVVMRRLPDERRLASLVTGDPGSAARCVDAVARRLAEFHRGASRGPAVDAAASSQAIARLWADELAETERFVGPVLDAATHHEVQALVARYLEGRGPLFAQRIAQGAVCDGHGDLLADDIFCTDAGPQILDCLEFSDRLRWADVVADVSFLAMDLESHGSADLSRRLWWAYAQATGSHWPITLAHHYTAYRAHVRAKVACLRFEQHGFAADRDAARMLLGLALTHARRARVRLVMVGGLPGTGKTTVARMAAQYLGARLLRADEVRKDIAGLAPGEHTVGAVDAGLYGPQRTEATYHALRERAAEALALGHSVVLDATHARADHREAVREMAAATSAELLEVCCVAARPVAVDRIEARARAGTDASDATEAVYDAMAARFASWPEAQELRTEDALDIVGRRVVDLLGGLTDQPGTGPEPQVVEESDDAGP